MSDRFIRADLVPISDDTSFAFGVIGESLSCTALVAEVDLTTGIVTLRLRREGERWGEDPDGVYG